MASSPPDDKRIYDFYIAARQSAALAAAVRAGLFEALDEQPMGSDALAQRLALAPRPVRLLTRALRAMGLLLARADGRLLLAEDASLYLVRGKPDWLGGLIDLEVDSFLSPAVLLAALERDKPTIYGDTDPWQQHARDPVRAQAFTQAMHSISARPARALAESVDLSGASRVLDIGGGSGALAIALAARHPKLRCVVWDLPVVCELAQPIIEASGLSERVTTLSGDIFAPDFPEGFDVVVLSQILHDWSQQTGLELLRRAHLALPAGGRVIVHEKLIADDGSGPLANSLVDLDMLVWTEGQQYSERALRRVLEHAGFGSIQLRATVGYWSVAEAFKA